MAELFTTPRVRELRDVRQILRENGISFFDREEIREYGHRYCVYVKDHDIDHACNVVDTGLMELEGDD